MTTERRVAGPWGDGWPEDAALAERAASGSREALGALFRRHGAEVHRLAYRVTGTTQDAEDVLQDVFVGLPRALARYREQGRFLAWLRQVTARVALARVRSASRRDAVPLFDAPLEPRAPSGPDVVDRIAVREALGRMPEGHRRVFLLKEVEGFDHSEIAALLGISIAASRVRLHRAWRFLDREVGGRS